MGGQRGTPGLRIIASGSFQPQSGLLDAESSPPCPVQQQPEAPLLPSLAFVSGQGAREPDVAAGRKNLVFAEQMEVPVLPSLAAAGGRGALEPDLAASWKEPGVAQACWVVPADLTLVQCAASPDYWLLFAVLGAGTGCGLLFSNNLGALKRVTL